MIFLAEPPGTRPHARRRPSHEFFRPERGGPTLEDILIDEGGEDLYLELDLYWAEHAGYNCYRDAFDCLKSSYGFLRGKGL